jgi:hypothetical protein
MCFEHNWEPLGYQFYRRIRQLFLSRFYVWDSLTPMDISAQSRGIVEDVEAATYGCVRLTNWDVEELAKRVKSTPVKFLAHSTL